MLVSPLALTRLTEEPAEAEVAPACGRMPISWAMEAMRAARCVVWPMAE